MSEFFNVDHFCSDSQIGRAESNRRQLITGLIFVVIILFSLLVIILVLYFSLKPEHFTYFVNRKMRANHNRDNLSYEALKMQNDGNTASAVECKVDGKADKVTPTNFSIFSLVGHQWQILRSGSSSLYSHQNHRAHIVTSSQLMYPSNRSPP